MDEDISISALPDEEYARKVCWRYIYRALIAIVVFLSLGFYSWRLNSESGFAMGCFLLAGFLPIYFIMHVWNVSNIHDPSALQALCGGGLEFRDNSLYLYRRNSTSVRIPVPEIHSIHWDGDRLVIKLEEMAWWIFRKSYSLRTGYLDPARIQAIAQAVEELLEQRESNRKSDVLSEGHEPDAL